MNGVSEPTFLGLASACGGGFLFLLGWCWWLNIKVSAVLATVQKVDDIHMAILGDMKTEGLISRTRRLEEQCHIRHPQSK